MDICTCNPQKHGTFFVNGRLICIYCRQPIADDTIADLEAQNILLTRTITEQAQVIREHQAADVIAVEAIRAQAAEIEQLKAALDKISKTAVTLGQPNSAWEQWRICAGTANKALGRV